jgi:hypothetical protein
MSRAWTQLYCTDYGWRVDIKNVRGSFARHHDRRGTHESQSSDLTAMHQIRSKLPKLLDRQIWNELPRLDPLSNESVLHNSPRIWIRRPGFNKILTTHNPMITDQRLPFAPTQWHPDVILSVHQRSNGHETVVHLVAARSRAAHHPRWTIVGAIPINNSHAPNTSVDRAAQGGDQGECDGGSYQRLTWGKVRPQCRRVPGGALFRWVTASVRNGLCYNGSRGGAASLLTWRRRQSAQRLNSRRAPAWRQVARHRGGWKSLAEVEVVQHWRRTRTARGIWERGKRMGARSTRGGFMQLGRCGRRGSRAVRCRNCRPDFPRAHRWCRCGEEEPYDVVPRVSVNLRCAHGDWWVGPARQWRWSPRYGQRATERLTSGVHLSAPLGSRSGSWAEWWHLASGSNSRVLARPPPILLFFIILNFLFCFLFLFLNCEFESKFCCEFYT